MVDVIATPAGIGAILEGRGLLHRISGGGISKADPYAHQPPPDPLRDASYRFESPSRFTATVRPRTRRRSCSSCYGREWTGSSPISGCPFRRRSSHPTEPATRRADRRQRLAMPCGTWPAATWSRAESMLCCGIVEEDVGAEGFQERPLVAPAQEQRLVEADAPLAQRADHALVRRRRARGDQRGADRRGLAGRERRLQPVQRVEEAAERPARQAVRARVARSCSWNAARPCSARRARIRRRRSPRRRRRRCAAGHGACCGGRAPAGWSPRRRRRASARRTSSGFADRNRCAPNGRMYGERSARPW